MAFLMKFFGWDYGKSLHVILKTCPMIRFTPVVKKAIDTYSDELQK